MRAEGDLGEGAILIDQEAHQEATPEEFLHEGHHQHHAGKAQADGEVKGQG